MSNRANLLEDNLYTLFREDVEHTSADLAKPIGENLTLTGYRFLDLLETLYVVRHLDTVSYTHLTLPTKAKV